LYESVLPKYLALKLDRFYETPHGVDEDLASIRAGSGIKGGGAAQLQGYSLRKENSDGENVLS
jgi:hypothetical protein